jgi:glycosyltransferase involved in cell wall biosynthesis
MVSVSASVMLFANTEWYLYNFRRSLASALINAGYKVLLVSPPGPFGEKLEALGFRWIAAPMHRLSLNPARELALVLWLRRLIVQERINLVHGFTIKCAVYGSIAARMSREVSRVNAIAGMGYVFSSNDVKAQLLRPAVRGLMQLALNGDSARLVLQNPDDVAFFEREGIVGRQLIRHIAGSGVDCNRFWPRTKTTEDQEGTALRVVLPARLLWDKGIKEFVEAAKVLREEGRKVDFLLAGEPDPGNPAAVPASAIQEWVSSGLVQALGHVHDMPALFHSVDIVVLPSYREGLPKGLIEAAACGLPLITTDVPGCREVVKDNVNGLLIPVKDPVALARAIGRLCEDPELRARLGAAARAHVLARYDETIIIRQTMSVYDELLTGGAGPSKLG